MSVRELKKEDFNLGFLELLNQLGTGTESLVTYEEFEKQFDKTDNFTYVLEMDKKIVASGSVLIEHKFRRGLSRIAHIEEIVVDTNYRGKGLARKILEHLISVSKDNNVYKIILDCDDDLVQFYEKIGFERKGTEMGMYM